MRVFLSRLRKQQRLASSKKQNNTICLLSGRIKIWSYPIFNIFLKHNILKEERFMIFQKVNNYCKENNVQST